MTYEPPRDTRDPNTPNARRRSSQSLGGWLPLVILAVAAVAVMAWMYPRASVDRMGDTTNAGPSIPAAEPSPSTSPPQAPARTPQQ